MTLFRDRLNDALSRQAPQIFHASKKRRGLRRRRMLLWPQGLESINLVHDKYSHPQRHRRTRERVLSRRPRFVSRSGHRRGHGRRRPRSPFRLFSRRRGRAAQLDIRDPRQAKLPSDRRRRRSDHRGGDERAPRAGARAHRLRREVRRDQRHRLAHPGRPRHLRPHAHRNRGRLGQRQPPSRRRRRSPRRLQRILAAANRLGAADPGAPDREVCGAVRGRRRLGLPLSPSGEQTARSRRERRLGARGLRPARRFPAGDGIADGGGGRRRGPRALQPLLAPLPRRGHRPR